MPHITVNGTRMYYEDHGEGPETIVFAHGLLWSGQMFEPQVAALKGQYRCITVDHRGQGQSEIAADGYDIDTLTEDIVALIQALDCGPCHFVGLSMGGFMGLRLGFRYPELLRSLILLETSADPESPESAKKYKMLNIIARLLGLGLVANQTMTIMFGQKFLNDSARADLKQTLRQRLVGNHRIGITRAVAGVVARDGVYDKIRQITIPTLIIVGDQDVATPVEKSERIHSQIANSQLHIIPGAGHTSTLEEPEAVTAAISNFLSILR
ncbi:MAG: alpha/beta hydrolase [Chloroflexota bacterium]